VTSPTKVKYLTPATFQHCFSRLLLGRAVPFTFAEDSAAIVTFAGYAVEADFYQGARIATQIIAYVLPQHKRSTVTTYILRRNLLRPYDRAIVSNTSMIDQGVLEKTVEFATGERPYRANSHRHKKRPSLHQSRRGGKRDRKALEINKRINDLFPMWIKTVERGGSVLRYHVSLITS